jgi:hypothetical protein
MDSGHKNCLGVKGPGCVEPSQVQWLRDQAKPGKGMLFCHIPLPEHLDLYNKYPYYGRVGNITPFSVNTGLFAAVVEAKAVQWISVGHNHGTDFYGAYKAGVWLGFGRKSGYGGRYPKNLKIGARVFEITLEPFGIDTWVREADGTVWKETEAKAKL